ncbi:hypothetical protein VR5_133 [Escherichia phage vb_EcoM-VR5]|uniref:Uncharacterized protein n=1 Tax=Escherichia phage vb_EcoM-VR5 TaxID=1567026 RepID=A0A0A7HEN6_9CAUD|nr:hypothetical protein AVV69_gp133 [Escherichia phage vb_EcoM-VR5]AIZ01920.1 hypothetical protein VR5_133 [Escherichia phage vb_EcoM-VR5]
MHKPSKTDPSYALADYDIAITLFAGLATGMLGGLVGLVMTTVMAAIEGVMPIEMGFFMIIAPAVVAYFIPVVYDICYTNALNAPARKRYALAMANYNEYVKQTKCNELETFIKECKS